MPQSKDKAGAAKATGSLSKDQVVKEYTQFIQELSSKAPAKVAPYVKQGAPHAALAIFYLMVAMPYIVKGLTMAQAIIAKLPDRLLRALLGFVLCFFGGFFPYLIAASEAWTVCGGDHAKECIKDLYQQYLKAQAANEQDGSAGPGTKDEAAMSQEVMLRKTQVLARSIDPEVLASGLTGVYTASIGVLAVLKINFARTVTLGERIGERVYVFASNYEKRIEDLLPAEDKKWVPVCLRWTCKAITIIMAWWIQRIISAFHSAMRGGHMLGVYLVEYLKENKIVQAGPDDSKIDEMVGWVLAAVGLLFQISTGFSFGFPLNLLFLPLRLLETMVVWSVSAF